MCGSYTLEQVARLWSKVDTTSNPRGCWPWKSTIISGYPYWRPGGRADETPLRATRIVLALVIGRDLTSEEKACHTCDNPICMRPDHLWLGTTALNNADAAAKGRTARGKRNGAYTHPHLIRRGQENYAAKLTDEDARQIKAGLAEGMTATELARLYGVTRSAISYIKQGKTWRHVT